MFVTVQYRYMLADLVLTINCLQELSLDDEICSVTRYGTGTRTEVSIKKKFTVNTAKI